MPDSRLSALAAGLLLALCSVTAHADGTQKYLEGLDAIAAGKFADAADGLTAALKAEPENADYFTARGVAYALSEKLTEAKADLTRADRLRPNNKQTKLWLATVVAMEGDFEQDQRIYPFATRDEYENEVRRMSRLYGNTTFYRKLGDQLAAQQKLAERKQAIDSIPHIARRFVARVKPGGAPAVPGAGQNPGEANKVAIALKERGLASYRQGNFAQAYDDLTSARHSLPADLDLAYHIAGCKLALGSFEGARAEYTALLLAKPDWTNALLGRALANASLGDAPAARRELEIVFQKQPGTNPAYREQIDKRLAGVSAALTGDAKAKLLDDLADAARRGESRQQLEQRAMTLLRAVNYDRLRSDERYQNRLNELRSKAIRPDATADDFAALGQYFYSEALVVLGEKVEPRAPHQAFRPQTDASQQREFAMAEAVLDEALKRDPGHARALAFKAGCRISRAQDWKSAEQLMNSALDRGGRDPVVLGMFATVADYIAYVLATQAAALRAVDTWQDSMYIYYRYPSKAELDQARQLDVLAGRMWARARKALQDAIDAEPGKATSFYYQGVLHERDRQFQAAATAYENAVRRDPKYLDAWQKLSVMLGRLGFVDKAHAAQQSAVNLVHTNSGPMLKLAWLHVRRTAYQSAEAALGVAARIDAADPRIAAYRGSIAREQEKHADAAAWFTAAAVLEEVRLRHDGHFVRTRTDASWDGSVVARLMVLSNLAADALNRVNRPKDALTMLELNLALSGRVPNAARYTPQYQGQIVEVPEKPETIPEAPNVETLAAWTAIYAGRANVAIRNYSAAIKLFEWAEGFEARKPPTLDVGMPIRVAAKWGTLGIIDADLKRGEEDDASRRMVQMYGHPSVATAEMTREADRLRTELEKRGKRSGGQTLHDLRDRQRRGVAE